MKSKQDFKSQFAIPFITFDQKNGFALNPDAQHFLQNIPQHKKLGVISIVGKYRTGKSFFVNRVLLDTKKSGFQVGPTINPCTKGLWLWKKTISLGQEKEVILIDTEGFGGMDQNVNHDSRIFLFSLLLSSYFIYNSIGSIDQNALNTINLIINLAQEIHKANGTQDQMKMMFPIFLWIVRDFSLQMVDKQGKKINQNQYLQKALQFQKGTLQSSQSKNKIRKLFKQFFPNRDCKTMVRPVESEVELQMLDELNNQMLRPEFLKQVMQIRKKIFSQVQTKTIRGKPLNGYGLLALCKNYIQTINKGSLPNIQNAWIYIRRNLAQNALNQSVYLLERKIQEYLKTPAEQSRIEEFRGQLWQYVYKQFTTRAIANRQQIPEYFQQLEKKFEILFEQYVRKNRQILRDMYQSVIDSHLSKIQFSNSLEPRSFSNSMKSPVVNLMDTLSYLTEEFKNLPNSKQKWEMLHLRTQQICKKAMEQIENQCREEKNLIESKQRVEIQFYKEKMEKMQKQNESKEKILKSKEQQLIEQRKESSINYKQLNDYKQQIEKYKTKNLMIEKQFNQKEMELESEKSHLLKQFEYKIEEMERKYQKLKNQKEMGFESEKSQLRKQFEYKIEEMERKYQKLKNQKEMGFESQKSQLRKQFEYKIEEAERKYQKLKNNLEKKESLFKVESEFNQKEIEMVRQNIKRYQRQNKMIKQELITAQNQIEKLKANITSLTQQKEKEIEEIRQTLQRKLSEHASNEIKKLQLEREHQEWLIEKNYLQNQVNFLKSQLDQNKRLHDSLLLALQQSVNSTQEINNHDLIETNRNLNNAVEKLDLRCKLFQQKIEKLKKYKRMIKGCTVLICSSCGKSINCSIFFKHLESCVNIKKKQKQNYLEQDDLKITITQTIVKETEDRKPYTEYLILVQQDNNQWSIARKYKNFCELQQTLVNTFPNLKFPQSANSVISSYTDINSLFTSKRPTVVQQRRKCLQNYLRDLCRIEQVRYNKAFISFLSLQKQEVNNSKNMTIQNFRKKYL